MVAPAGFQRRVGGEGLAGFGDFCFAGKDEAGKHQRLCSRSAFGEAPINQHLIDAQFWRGAGFERRKGQIGGLISNCNKGGSRGGLFNAAPHSIGCG